MTTVSHIRCGNTRHQHGNPYASDNMSDVTPPTRGNRSLTDQGKVSKVLKFRFRVTTGKGDKPVAPSLIHTHWIDAIQEAFGSDVDIINNKNTISNFKILRTSLSVSSFTRPFTTRLSSTTMVDRPRFTIRSKYALKPAISSALSTSRW